jgi:hypothetical protein
VTDIERAVEIGYETLRIDRAIHELNVAIQNRGYDRTAIYETDLFKKLEAYRETLRKELWDMAF